MPMKMEALRIAGHDRAAATGTKRASFKELETTHYERSGIWCERGPRMDWMWQLYEHMPDAVFFMSDDRKIAACNRAAVTLFGYQESEMLGRALDFLWYSTPDVQLMGRWADRGAVGVGMAITKGGAQFPIVLTLIGEECENSTLSVAIFEDVRPDRGPLRQIQDLRRELARLAAMIAAINGTMRQSRYNSTVACSENVTARRRRLTERENQVLNCVLDGLQNKMIAHHLGISARTVEAHRANVMAKIGARNLAELIRMTIIIDDVTQPLPVTRAGGGCRPHIRKL